MRKNIFKSEILQSLGVHWNKQQNNLKIISVACFEILVTIKKKPCEKQNVSLTKTLTLIERW